MSRLPSLTFEPRQDQSITAQRLASMRRQPRVFQVFDLSSTGTP